MGEIERVLKEVEQVALEMVPSCFEVLSVQLTPVDPSFPSPTPFSIAVRVVRRNDDPEPGGWGYALAERVRGRWDRDDFQIVIREEAGDTTTEAQ